MRDIVEISKMKQDYETIPIPLDLKQRVKEGVQAPPF